jgi:Fe-S cluster assembly protein SufD
MTLTTNVRDAVETSDRVASHLHPPGSFDLDDYPVPTGREEVWRFTPLRRLRGLHTDSALDGVGRYAVAQTPAGVVAESRPLTDPLRGSSGYVPSDRVSARAWHAVADLFVVDVSRETIVVAPIAVGVSGADVETPTASHLVVNVQPFAKATVILSHEGSATLADNVEIIVGDGAQLTFVTVQDWDAVSVHHSHHHALVGRDATLRHVAVTFGGDVVRMNTSVEYGGPGADAELLGVYFADAGQHLEHRLFVDHNAPKTRSNVVYKGALQGKGAHAVWVGDVLIRKVAEGIETFETNRNLVLTDGCRADSVPNLEIETGEIAGAGHASATGRFDDEQLFYLMSRGITHDEARRLVVHGFFADIIRKIGVPDVEQRLLAAVERELAAEFDRSGAPAS